MQEQEGMINIRVEPDGKTVTFDRLNSVQQLLNRLHLGRNDALVIRDGRLLTPDVMLGRADEITVRLVGSRG